MRVTSSEPALVTMKEAGPLTLPAKGRGAIRLSVASARIGTAADVFLYVTDEEGLVEETLCLKCAWK